MYRIPVPELEIAKVVTMLEKAQDPEGGYNTDDESDEEIAGENDQFYPDDEQIQSGPNDTDNNENDLHHDFVNSNNDQTTSHDNQVACQSSTVLKPKIRKSTSKTSSSKPGLKISLGLF